MMLKKILTLVTLSLVWLPVSHALAQADVNFSEGLFPELGGSVIGATTAEPAIWKSRYYVEEGAETGRLEVEVVLADGWHVYSLTQPPGGPLPTKLSVAGPNGVRASAGFKPDREPNRSVSIVFKGVTVEDYESKVTWSAPLMLPSGFRDKVEVNVNALVCKNDGSCVPVDEVIEASFAGDAPAPASGSRADVEAKPPAKEDGKPASFRDEDYVVQWRGELIPSEVQPGDRATLRITAFPDPMFHVYAAAVDDTESSTNFVITEKSGLRVGKPATDQPIITKSLLPTLPPIRYHHGEVRWELPVVVPADASTGKYPLEGSIAYQACTDTSCLQPKAIRISTELIVTDSSSGEREPAAVKFVSTEPAPVLDAAAETDWVDAVAPAGDAPSPASPRGPPGSRGSADNDPDSGEGTTNTAANAAPDSKAIAPPLSGSLSSDASGPISFPLVLLMAFAGGVILNVMPCVLPVVGLKVMSFVKQAGEDRGRVFALNLVYVLGILAVFALLAGLAVAFSFSWGEQFTYFKVRLGLALVLFALALSYLGVWEIPVPGMAAGKASQELQSREGYVGAFSKGVFATILATPCSGPLLGYILGLTITLSSLETVIVIMSVGVGMALPYLIIGARPALVSWLPKPGPWMETLKQFLAFLFLGTVAFFFAGFNDEHRVPVFVSLIGVWFGCWLIGLVPNWESINKRIAAWVAGVAAATVIGLASFHYLVPGEKVLAWEPYDEVRLQQLQREGRTVMVDFTAKWCVNCIVNYNVAINTEPTRRLIEQLDAVPMLADWTDRDPEIKAKLTELQSRSIPVLAVYPGAKPSEPIVLRDLLSQNDVLEALQQAGPSVQGTSTVSRSAAPPLQPALH